MIFFDLNDKEKTLSSHLQDIRKQFLVAITYFLLIFFTIIYFSKNIYNYLTSPLINILNKYTSSYSLIITSLPEGFTAYIKMSFFVALFIFVPFFTIQLLLFVLPTIKVSYKKTFIITMLLTPILFYIGICFSYYFAFQVIWEFFVKFAVSHNMTLSLKISDYISLALKVMFGLGISFELPIILFILYKLNILSYKFLKKSRRLAILLAFIIAAIFTPPDPFSQIIMALILIFLYELSLIIINLDSKQ